MRRRFHAGRHQRGAAERRSCWRWSTAERTDREVETTRTYGQRSGKVVSAAAENETYPLDKRSNKV